MLLPYSFGCLFGALFFQSTRIIVDLNEITRLFVFHSLHSRHYRERTILKKAKKRLQGYFVICSVAELRKGLEEIVEGSADDCQKLRLWNVNFPITLNYLMVP